MYIKYVFAKEKIKEKIKEFAYEKQEAIGVIEIILILVVLVALVLVFRTQITAIVKTAFATITKDSGTINSSIDIK